MPRNSPPIAPPTAWTRPESLAAFGAALRARRESLALTLDLLAQATGISKPYLSNIETARAPGPPSEEKLRKLARALQLPPADLLAGADWLRAPASIRKALAAAAPGIAAEMNAEAQPRRADGTLNLDAMMGARRFTNDQSASVVSENRTEAQIIPLRSIPLINRVAAGAPSEFTDFSYPAGIADQYVPAPDLPEAPISSAFAVRVIGDSMAPDYRAGEILIVGPGEPRDGDDCVVRLGELEQFATTFKRIFFVTQAAEAHDVDSVRLVPLNPAHPERTVPLDRITGIYPVIYRLTPAPRQRADTPVPAPVEPPRSFTSSQISIEND